MLLVISLGRFQAFGDEINIPLRSPDAGWRLLLKGVKDVRGFLEANRVHRSISVSVVRLDDLQHARAESFQGFAIGAIPPNLRDAERVAHVLLDRRGKAQEIALLVGCQDASHRTKMIIPILGYFSNRLFDARPSKRHFGFVIA